jgi:hypothetical protein
MWKPFKPKEYPAEPMQEVKQEIVPVQPQVQPLQVARPAPVQPKQEEGITEEEVIKSLSNIGDGLRNHEIRIQSLEAALYRLKALV